MYLSDDITHDYHLVNHFTLAALAYAKEHANLKRAYIFSDGCAAQYKGKGTFADLSLLSGLSVQRIYYGSEHGKGEADGETGVLSQALARAVQGGQVNISNGKDLFEWARETMSKETPLFCRKFFLVDQESVNRQRPETDIQTVPGTRQFHQVGITNVSFCCYFISLFVLSIIAFFSGFSLMHCSHHSRLSASPTISSGVESWHVFAQDAGWIDLPAVSTRSTLGTIRR